MKKLLCVLMAVLVLTGTAFAEEEFTLHNGTKFGMTLEEVLDIENSKGVELEAGDRYLVSKGGIIVADVPNSEIRYLFDSDNKLVLMNYNFACYGENINPLGSYYSVENGLTAKYGPAECSSLNNTEFPSLTDGIPFTSAVKKGTDSTLIFQRLDYSHRLIESPNGDYVFVEHFTYHTISQRDGRPDREYDDHVLYYRLLTESEANVIMNGIITGNDDL